MRDLGGRERPMRQPAELQRSGASQWTPESGRPIPGASEWLDEHWHEYEGLWVAVGPQGLAAAGRSVAELREKLGCFSGLLLAHVV
jgi:hypothetical protein